MRKPTKVRLTPMAASSASPAAFLGALAAVADTQSGALAEAQAIADVMEIVAVDGAGLRDNTAATLMHLLNERLHDVRTAIDASWLRAGGRL